VGLGSIGVGGGKIGSGRVKSNEEDKVFPSGLSSFEGRVNTS